MNDTDHMEVKFFPPSPLSWFIRTRKEDLAAEGVLILGRGSRPNLLAKDFDSCAAKLLIQSQMT